MKHTPGPTVVKIREYLLSKLSDKEIRALNKWNKKWKPVIAKVEEV